MSRFGSPLGKGSPTFLATQAHLEDQLSELEAFRHELNALYEAKDAELQQVRLGAVAARAEAEHAITQQETLSAENRALRTWNQQLADELAQQLSRLRELDDSMMPPPLPPAGSSSSKPVAQLAVQQRQALDASSSGMRLARVQAELRAAHEAHAQLQQSAQALSTDFSAATRQIGKLEHRIAEQGRAAAELEGLKVSLGAQREALEKSESMRREAEVNTRPALSPF